MPTTPLCGWTQQQTPVAQACVTPVAFLDSVGSAVPTTPLCGWTQQHTPVAQAYVTPVALVGALGVQQYHLCGVRLWVRGFFVGASPSPLPPTLSPICRKEICLLFWLVLPGSPAPPVSCCFLFFVCVVPALTFDQRLN
jgi:hypothetical protein